ncbi:MAG: hypothetical protein HGA70_04860 [Chlorobiaceae bacterium]|nr:hypothetical protein [Chlorobiaceae bacterium]NTW11212.1 hypothetical protein [Chlorobiaceae bacterium]
MTVNELIKTIGNVIVKIDVTRSSLDRNTPQRVHLDNDRDELDTFQRKIVRSVIDENSVEFKKHTAALKEADKELGRTMDDLKRLVETLANLDKFIAAVGKIAVLIV